LFWQQQTPQDRLEALAAIHEDVELVEKAKQHAKADKRTKGKKC
jgi:hypothetical protein